MVSSAGLSKLPLTMESVPITANSEEEKNQNVFEFTSIQGSLNSDSILGGGTFEVPLRF